jgi:hypothetical protein
VTSTFKKLYLTSDPQNRDKTTLKRPINSPRSYINHNSSLKSLLSLDAFIPSTARSRKLLETLSHQSGSIAFTRSPDPWQIRPSLKVHGGCNRVDVAFYSERLSDWSCDKGVRLAGSMHLELWPLLRLALLCGETAPGSCCLRSVGAWDLSRCRVVVGATGIWRSSLERAMGIIYLLDPALPGVVICEVNLVLVVGDG